MHGGLAGFAYDDCDASLNETNPAAIWPGAGYAELSIPGVAWAWVGACNQSTCPVISDLRRTFQSPVCVFWVSSCARHGLPSGHSHFTPGELQFQPFLVTSSGPSDGYFLHVVESTFQSKALRTPLLISEKTHSPVRGCMVWQISSIHTHIYTDKLIYANIKKPQHDLNQLGLRETSKPDATLNFWAGNPRNFKTLLT